jgi:hypothetical protein
MRITMRKTLSIAAISLAATALLSLAACKRADETTAVPAAATVAAPATMAPAIAATVERPIGISDAPAPGEHTVFDAKAFAGTFAQDGTHVAFTADGTYTMTAHAESANADLATDGTWTLEPDARHVRLDPNSKADADRVYEIVSMDELHAADGQVLRREGAAQ